MNAPNTRGYPLLTVDETGVMGRSGRELVTAPG
jgi:hypothetical protein